MQASAIAHPNVALIKYWGKRDTARNLPATGSLSLTLGGLQTRTSVRFAPEFERDTVYVNEAPDAVADARVTACLDVLREQAGVTLRARIDSHNDFPTGAGLASSASGYAALVRAAAAALGLDLAAAALENIARMGSGSAPRSLYSGIVVLDAGAAEVRCATLATPADWPLEVVVAVTSRAPKPVGSTAGMERSRATSPYYPAWLDSHPADMEAAAACVRERDFARLAELSEHSCLKMHALALSARPPLNYWNPATVAAMQTITELRAAGCPVFFTIDAGPQLKAVCLPSATAQVRAALRDVPGVIDLLSSGLGEAARVVDDD